MMSQDNAYMFYFSQWTQNTSSFRNLLNSSKGRDKFLQLLQYVSNVYVTCMRESTEYGAQVREKMNPHVNKVKKFESSLSNSRKVFRLLLFMNEMAEFQDLLKSQKFPIPMKVLKIISTICSFIYYLTDNIVYLANLDFVRPTVPGMKGYKWKQLKNMFSLTKTLMEIIIAIYQIHLKVEAENEIILKLRRFNAEVVIWSSEANVLVRQMIGLRREAIFHRIEANIFFLRMLMLIKSLKLVGESWLNPVFVSLCGVAQASLSVYKGMKGKQEVYKLTVEDIHQENLKATTVIVNTLQPGTENQRARLLSNIAEDIRRQQSLNIATLQPKQLVMGADEFDIKPAARRHSSSVRQSRPT